MLEELPPADSALASSAGRALGLWQVVGKKWMVFKGYCCACDLTVNPDLKAIFAEARQRFMSLGGTECQRAAGTNVVSELLTCFILWLLVKMDWRMSAGTL